MGKKKTGLITDEVRELINEVARETASMAYIDGMGGEVNYFRAMESCFLIIKSWPRWWPIMKPIHMWSFKAEARVFQAIPLRAGTHTARRKIYLTK